MEIFWQEMSFGLGDGHYLARVILRLLAAVLFGAAIGYEREKAGKAAGLRTHVLVTLGTCVFVVAATGAAMGPDAQSRIIQGIVTGIGFIGAGAILKLDREKNIRGLTSSAGIWIAAAIGVSVGLGEIGLALLTTIITVVVLALVPSGEANEEEQ